MVYQPIRTPDDVGQRLVAGVTSEDHWLEFKGEPFANDSDGKRKCLRAVAQFANASGGTVVIGAQSTAEVLNAFASVSNPDEQVRWIDDLVKGNLEPVPGIEPVVIALSTGTVLLALNVPPAPTLIGHRIGEAYEFPIRAASSRRYLRVAEMEARMQARERLQRLRLERIARDEPVGIDAMLRTPELAHNDWRVEAVDDDVVILRHGRISTAVPLAYVETVYRAGEPEAEWVVSLSCYLTKPGQLQLIQVTKGQPWGTSTSTYHQRGVSQPSR